jgi:hypothetical protein
LDTDDAIAAEILDDLLGSADDSTWGGVEVSGAR